MNLTAELKRQTAAVTCGYPHVHWNGYCTLAKYKNGYPIPATRIVAYLRRYNPALLAALPIIVGSRVRVVKPLSLSFPAMGLEGKVERIDGGQATVDDGDGTHVTGYVENFQRA